MSMPTKSSKPNIMKPKPKFLNSHELVTLLVGKGPNAKKFVLHKEVVCCYSPVLKTAFNGAFIEGQTQKYRFEDVSEGACQFLVQWIYNRDMTVASQEKSKYDIKEFSDLVQLWVLAGKLLMPALQNMTMQAMSDIIVRTNTVPCTLFDYVYENTGPDSPLRRFFVDTCANSPRLMANTGRHSVFPKEMLVELVSALAQIASETPRRSLALFLDAKNYEVKEIKEVENQEVEET